MSLRRKQWVVPGLLPLLPARDVPRLPILDWSWSRGDVTHFATAPTLAEWPPGAPRTSRARALAAAAGLLSFARQWLIAEPIHLHVEGDGLILHDAHVLALSADEARSFCCHLDEHFAPEGLRFFPVRPGEWLVGAMEPLALVTTAPIARLGRSIDGYLPEGLHRDVWLARFNMAQMVLHEHPLNLARRDAGQRVVSGVWFWDEDSTQQGQETLLTLRHLSAYGDGEAWTEAARHFEQELWAPAVAELLDGKLDSLGLVALEGCGAAQLELRRAHRWRWWRSTRSMLDAAAVVAL